MKNYWQWGHVINLCLGEEGLSSLFTCRNIWIGYSGGMDSTVLLHRLAHHPSLRSKLKVVHVNHGLSPQAWAWEAHCQTVCEALQIPLQINHLVLNVCSNLEETARQARYHVFEKCIKVGDVLVLGHHKNDQAETLLLNLCRGAGVDGLAAMKPFKPLFKGFVWRPFLRYSRRTLETYAEQHRLSWIQDESNEDQHFGRNYLRHTILPLLEARWPAVTDHLAKASAHCQQSQAHLDELACLDCPELVFPTKTLLTTRLSELPKSRALNVLRYWLRSNDIGIPSTNLMNKIVSEVIQAKRSANPTLAWGVVCIKRYQNRLHLLMQPTTTPAIPIIPAISVTTVLPSTSVCATRASDRSGMVEIEWSSFPSRLAVGVGVHLEAKLALEGIEILPETAVSIRFRQGGERFYWRQQTKALKKLLQEWKVPVWLRGSIPLVYINGRLAAVVGYAISDHFYRQNKVHLYQLALDQM